MDFTSRYPGVKPFETHEQHVFFGRTADIQVLHSLVGVEKTVLLYSKSGLGKSSLINAGLIPALTQDKRFNYKPVTIRFGVYSKNNTVSPKEKILDQLKSGAPRNPFGLYSELYENTLSFQIKMTAMAFPGRTTVLVFDQFEELFTYPDEQIAELKTELHDLLYKKSSVHFRDNIQQLLENNPEVLPEEQLNILSSAVNIRMVFAIRNDFLSLLNRLTDYLPGLQRTFYELKPLCHEEARTAIMKPAATEGDFPCPKFEFTGDAIDKILSALSENGKQPIETFQLQIVCQHAEGLILKNPKKRVISAEDLGDIKEIHQSFYHNLMAELRTENEEEKARLRVLLEEQFIYEPEHRRLQVFKGIILKQISQETLSALEKTHLIRSEPYQDSFTFELSHDTLVEPVLKSFRIRKEAEEHSNHERVRQEELRRIGQKAARQRKLLFIISLAALVFSGFAMFGFFMWNRASKALKEVQRAEIIATIQKSVADSALNIANNIIEHLIFFDGKYALAIKKKYGDRIYYGFIDKQGKTKIDFTYDAASPFDQNTGYSKVRRADQLFLIDTTGSIEYGLCEATGQLNPSISALDMQNRELREVPAEIFKNSQIKILQLHGNFIGQIPKEVGNLSDALMFLDFSHNRLTSLPDEIGQLHKLQTLDLEFNKLRNLPEQIGKLTSLANLRLGNNELNYLPQSIGNLTSLKILNIEDNQLTSLPDGIWNLESLITLYLNGNRLQHLPGSIGKLINLKTLMLRNMKLTSLPGEIGHLTRLEDLRLARNELNSLPIEIKNLKNLKILSLFQNDFTTVPADIFYLENLTLLNLGSNKLTAIPKEIGKLHKLAILDLSGLRLQDFPAELWQLENLKELRLSSNNLRSLPDEIGNLKQLEELWLGGNDFSGHEKERIQQLLPECRIDWEQTK